MRLSKEDAAVLNRYPDLKAARLCCLARRRTATARLADLPARGGNRSVQLDRWAAKHSLRIENPDVYVAAAKLRAGGYENMLEASNAYS